MSCDVKVAELFAGVGGFRLGLEGYHSDEHPDFDMPCAGEYVTVWANQWEPPGTVAKQFAWRCYEERFGEGSCVNEDIHAVLDGYGRGEVTIPDVDMLVGGFPCFVTGTPVLTANGYIPIEDVTAGDVVLTHEGRYRRVVRCGTTSDAPLVQVRVMGCEPLRCTPNHPFMVRSIVDGRSFGELHTCAASELVAGTDFVMAAMSEEDLVVARCLGHIEGSVRCVSDGREYLPVLGVDALDVRERVYNFEVEEDHTYAVSRCVVHNCQDYSVARPLSHSGGIEGKKGVLWWDIYRFLKLKSPRYCLFENVDRLLKSPAASRGRDFAIILSCLMSLGYAVEWRVVNSAEYGFPQRRKRVFIYAEKDVSWDMPSWLATGGVMAHALPARLVGDAHSFDIGRDPYDITGTWPSHKVSPFLDAGVACDFHVMTSKVEANYTGARQVLGDVAVDGADVPSEYWVADDQLPRWEYLKGAKREERVSKDGHRYCYSEGAMAYPDLLTNPSRTILTGEGGRAASRFKHIIEQGGRYRRLVPDELDLLQGFPRGWTDVGMTDGQRAFCMGNALVVGVVNRIGKAIFDHVRN